jgi:alkanesulfonate monooxygenase SsuD/methylene tetrahydromethanopterin reductase-like flavin-dependent oxidoreductase (luciferase family)
MTHIELGWVMPAGFRDKSLRPEYMATLNRGLEMIKPRFDSAWYVDHLMFEGNDQVEGWTALTYMAAQHPQLRFGHAVLCQSFRNPGLVAKMGATFQFMSGGRFILGLGAGWHEPEYKAYGFPFPSAGTRVEQLEEYVQIIKAMWRDERATFEGKHYRVEEAYCEPKAEPVPPIMLGAMMPRMIGLTVRYADWWNVSWTTLEDYKGMVEVCERECEEQGRDPKSLRRTWFGGCACAPTEAELDDLFGDRPRPEGGIVGTPKQVIEQMQAFIDLGVDYFMLGSVGTPRLTTLESLLDQVVPELDKGA